MRIEPFDNKRSFGGTLEYEGHFTHNNLYVLNRHERDLNTKKGKLFKKYHAEDHYDSWNYYLTRQTTWLNVFYKK